MGAGLCAPTLFHAADQPRPHRFPLFQSLGEGAFKHRRSDLVGEAVFIDLTRHEMNGGTPSDPEQGRPLAASVATAPPRLQVPGHGATSWPHRNGLY
jgi:hypothetical protein